MKLALVGDIHANLPALQAVLADLDRWGPDVVVILGDTVNRGPHPRECHDLVAARTARPGPGPAWHVLLGNHEEYVIAIHRDPPQPGTPAFAVHQHTHWTMTRIAHAITELSALPHRLDLPSPAGRAAFTHASLRGNRVGIYPEIAPAELDPLVDRAASLFGVGHTHRPLLRRHGATLVVNAGSVGLPFDGDRRAGYVRAEAHSGGWQVAIHRVTYDWQSAHRDYAGGEFAAASGQIGRVICRELELAQPLLAKWTARYEQAVLERAISMEQAVTDFLHAFAS